MSNSRLIDAQARHREHPATFEVPTPDLLWAIEPGWLCKLGFLTDEYTKVRWHVDVERMWVKVTGRDGDRIIGILDNTPVYTEDKFGDTVAFAPHNVLDVLPPREGSHAEA